MPEDKENSSFYKRVEGNIYNIYQSNDLLEVETHMFGDELLYIPAITDHSH